MSKNIKLAGAVLVLIILCLLPLFVKEFVATMAIRIMYYGLMAIAFYFLAWQLGLFSLMIPVFMGITAFSIAILESRNIIFFPYSTLCGILISLLLAAFFGLLANRSKEVYFLMLTLVLGQLVWALVLQWTSLTKGTTGISGIEIPGFIALFGSPNRGFYYFTLIIFLLVILGLTAINKSPFGLRLRGIRESESRMIMLGYNVAALKWWAFMVSSFVASLSGVCYVYYSGLINPDAMTLNASTQVLIASIFGGVNSILGAIAGTAIIKTLEIVLSGITQRYLLIIGILFLLVIIYAPKGVVGILEGIWWRVVKVRENSGVKD